MIKLIEKNSSFNCIVTEFYRPLFEEFIKPCFLNSNIKLNAINNENIFGQGFQQPEFIKAIIFKLEQIIKSLHETRFAVWMDVDIILNQSPEKIIYDLQKKIKGYDIIISPENRCGNINSGFFATISNKRTINFFSEVLEQIKKYNTTEQPTIERLLESRKIKFSVLPDTYWNLTVDFPIPQDVKIIHANWIAHSKLGKLKGKNYVEKKISALRKLKKMNEKIDKFF